MYGGIWESQKHVPDKIVPNSRPNAFCDCYTKSVSPVNRQT